MRVLPLSRSLPSAPLRPVASCTALQIRAALLDFLKEKTISVKAAQGKSAGELKGKFVIGTLFQDRERMEFSKRYFQMAGKSEEDTVATGNASLKKIEKRPW